MVSVGSERSGPERWHFYLGGKIDVGTNQLPPKEATHMSRDVKYIGMDVHKEAIEIAVRNAGGKLVMESIVETNTLSLAVSRTRWFLYRSLNGALQSMAAALIPALAIPVIAALSGGHYPVSDAFLLGLRMGLGGMLFYAIGLLLSTLFAGDFTSAGIGIALVYAVTLG